MPPYNMTIIRRPTGSIPDRLPDPARLLKILLMAHGDRSEGPPDITAERVLSKSPSPEHHIAEATFTCELPLEILRDRELVTTLEGAYGYDIVIQHARPDPQQPKPPRLAVFDMDSTLIQQEVIDLLAARAGPDAAPRVAAITARAMNGELDFEASLRERVALLAGLPATVFDELKPELTMSPGAEALLRCLKKLGVRTALLSGGFVPLAKFVAGRLGIDHVHANQLEVGADGMLTGKLLEGAEIVHSQRKKELLLSIAGQEGVAVEDVLAVGDGANDLPMMWAAGLGVAVHAKPKVQESAPARLNTGLLDVLYLMGYHEEDIEKLAASS